MRPTPDIKDCNRVAKKVALKIKIDANLEVFLWVLMFWGKRNWKDLHFNLIFL